MFTKVFILVVFYFIYGFTAFAQCDSSMIRYLHKNEMANHKSKIYCYKYLSLDNKSYMINPTNERDKIFNDSLIIPEKLKEPFSFIHISLFHKLVVVKNNRSLFFERTRYSILPVVRASQKRIFKYAHKFLFDKNFTEPCIFLISGFNCYFIIKNNRLYIQPYNNPALILPAQEVIDCCWDNIKPPEDLPLTPLQIATSAEYEKSNSHYFVFIRDADSIQFRVNNGSITQSDSTIAPCFTYYFYLKKGEPNRYYRYDFEAEFIVKNDELFIKPTKTSPGFLAAQEAIDCCWDNIKPKVR